MYRIIGQYSVLLVLKYFCASKNIDENPFVTDFLRFFYVNSIFSYPHTCISIGTSKKDPDSELALRYTPSLVNESLVSTISYEPSSLSKS